MGRKRHIAVDTLGLFAALGVSAASLTDSMVGQQVPDDIACRTPSVSKAWVYGGYNAQVVDHSDALIAHTRAPGSLRTRIHR